MKKIYLKLAGIFCCLSMIFALCACSVRNIGYGIDVRGEGEVITQEYEVNGNRLSVKDIHVKQGTRTYQADIILCGGTEKKVTISAQEPLLSHFTVKEANGTISICGKATENYVTESVTVGIYGYTFDTVSLSCVRGTMEEGVIGENGTLYLSGASEIVVDTLNKKSFNADVSGASKLTVGTFSVESLELDLSGASFATADRMTCAEAEIELSGASNVSCSDATISSLELEASGASRVTLTGKGTEVKADLNGASDAKLGAFETQTMRISLSGASDANVYVAKTLTVSASGASSLVYHGDCALIENSVSGGSSVKKG